MSEDLREYGRRSDRIHGDRIAIVETEGIDDPEKLLRVQVRVLDLMENVPVADLPWAEYKLPVGARVNDGSFVPVKKGDVVWTDFPYNGDSRRPRITGSVHYAPDKVPNLPHETFAGASAYAHRRTGEEPDQAAHEYGKDAVSTIHGVTVEINRDGSYSLYQRSTGTETTITKDGDLIYHVEGSIYRSATGDQKAVIDGLEKVEIMGSQSTVAMGGIEHDGGTGSPAGNVTFKCICAYTRKEHPMASSNVKSSL